MTSRPTLKVVFLVGSDSESTVRSIQAVCRVAGVKPLAALKDTEAPSWRRRWKNLKRNVRREGKFYVLRRALAALREISEALVERAAVRASDVGKCLRASFPGKAFSLSSLGEQYGFPVIPAGNLNGPQAAGMLASLGADLGIVIGTRILKRSTFSVPEMGCINLHKGKVPEYRGMPPGFWELYDGAESAGVTVHFVDDGLDTGDVIARSEVPLTPLETPESLREKLNREGAATLAAAVRSIQAGEAVRERQAFTARKPRTSPTWREVQELRKKLPHWRQPGDASQIVKNVYCLLVYYSGLFWLSRRARRIWGSRACVILYHRVNDFSKDVLTVDTETFAAQLIAIARRYKPISTGELVEHLRSRKRILPTAVAIHFDDCYRDVVGNAMPILKSVDFPAAVFVSSGYVDTSRPFQHDVKKYPFEYENLRAGDLRTWLQYGFEVGAHTVNHVDLGACSSTDARYEVTVSREQLTSLISAPADAPERDATEVIRFFSYPFGGVHNIRSDVANMVQEAGYSALFSAYGGFVGRKTSVFDIPRIGSSYQTRPLYLLLEIEELMPKQILAKLKWRQGTKP